MKRISLFLCYAFVCASMRAAGEPYVPYKQPYSMAPTTTSVKILWQMAEETGPTDAVVYYGTDPNNLNQSLLSSDGWNVAEEGYMHVVTLTGLQPNTRYFFTPGAPFLSQVPLMSSVGNHETGAKAEFNSISPKNCGQ